MAAVFLMFLHSSVYAAEDTEDSTLEISTTKKSNEKKTTKENSTKKILIIPNLIKTTTSSTTPPETITNPLPPSQDLPTQSSKNYPIKVQFLRRHSITEPRYKGADYLWKLLQNFKFT